MPEAETVTVTRVVDKADELEVDLSELTVTSNPCDVALVRDRLTAYLEKGKAIERALDALMLEWIIKNNRPITIGPVRYVAAVPGTVKCASVPQAMEALMEACEGDWSRVCDCLSANAIKYGTARKLLPPERYDALFVKETKQTLKREGPKSEKPAIEPREDGKELMRFDERFVK